MAIIEKWKTSLTTCLYLLALTWDELLLLVSFSFLAKRFFFLWRGLDSRIISSSSKVGSQFSLPFWRGERGGLKGSEPVLRSLLQTGLHLGAEFCKKDALIIIAHAAKSTGHTPDILYQSLQLGAIFKVWQRLLLCSCFDSALWMLWSGNEEEDSVLAGLCLFESSTTASGTGLQAIQNCTHHRETQQKGWIYN